MQQRATGALGLSLCCVLSCVSEQAGRAAQTEPVLDAGGEASLNTGDSTPALASEPQSVAGQSTATESVATESAAPPPVGSPSSGGSSASGPVSASTTSPSTPSADVTLRASSAEATGAITTGTAAESTEPTSRASDATGEATSSGVESSAALPGAGDPAFPPLSDGVPLGSDSILGGFYDVQLAPLPDVEGCKAEATESHYHFVLEENEDLEMDARLSTDFAFAARVGYSATTEVLAVTPYPFLEVRFSRNPDGTFTGVGEAWVRYECSTGTTARRVAATVSPDVTPPRLRVTHDFPTEYTPGGYSVPVGVHFRFAFSETVDLGSGELRQAPATGEELEGLIAVVDEETQQVVASRAASGTGGALALELTDYDGARKRNVRFAYNYSARDRAGNPLAPPTQTFHLMDVGPLQSVIDFDDGPYAGTNGNARYVAAGTPDSPCESGGCVVIEEDVPLCDDWLANGPTSTFNFRLPLPEVTDSFRVRWRLLGSQTVVAGPRLWWHKGCNLEVVPAVLPLLKEPEGTFTHGTPWQHSDMSLSVCSGKGADKSLALTLTCIHPQDLPPGGARMRYVIERIEQLEP